VGALAAAVTGRRRRVLLRAVFYSLAILLGLPLAFAHVMTRTFRRPVSPVPPEGWRAVTLHADGLRLRAWTAPGLPARASVVVAHGVGDSLESFVEFGRSLRERGHPVLLLDLRGHGGSEGVLSTLGGHEARDVRAALDYLRTDPAGKNGTIVMGFSMGAVASLLASAGRDDVRAVVIEAPYDSYRDTVRHHAWLLYRIPRWTPLVPLSIALAEWRAGFDADDVDAVVAARSVRAVHDGEQRRADRPDAGGGRPARLRRASGAAPAVDRAGSGTRGRLTAPRLLAGRHGLPGSERPLKR
jgi:pimeloyl-ACP methyl ester carboxylesterase